MSSLARISAIGIVGLGLGTAPGAWSAEPATQKVATMGTGEPADPGNPSKSGGGIQPSPSSEPARPATASRIASEPSTPSGGGYSWSNKKTPHKPAKHKILLDPRRPVAQAPSFELRPDGTSVVTLTLSQSVEVTQWSQGRRVEYRLKGAQIGINNNTNPLITDHFPTPVGRIALKKTNRGAVLVLDLRESIQPTHQLRSDASGGSVLEVLLPKPSQPRAARTIIRQPKPAREDASKHRERATRGSPAKAGPGPRL